MAAHRLMPAHSWRSDEAMSLICGYCINCVDRHCKKDVPYYAVSIRCKEFQEAEYEVEVPTPSDNTEQMKIALGSLVETL